MSNADFGAFLERSLELLADEQPAQHRRLCERMAGEAVHFEVDGRRLVMRFEAGGVALDARLPVDGATLARLDRSTVLDLVDGVVSLPDAILSDRFHLRADLEGVVRFHDALLLYLRGALRCPGFPALLSAYRQGNPPPSAPVRSEVSS